MGVFVITESVWGFVFLRVKIYSAPTDGHW